MFFHRLRLKKWLGKLMWKHNEGNDLSGAKLRRDSGKVNQESRNKKPRYSAGFFLFQRRGLTLDPNEPCRFVAAL
jgi:hypothetical protein